MKVPSHRISYAIYLFQLPNVIVEIFSYDI
jgi:hypothetical protein